MTVNGLHIFVTLFVQLISQKRGCPESMNISSCFRGILFFIHGLDAPRPMARFHFYDCLASSVTAIAHMLRGITGFYLAYASALLSRIRRLRHRKHSHTVRRHQGFYHRPFRIRYLFLPQLPQTKVFFFGKSWQFCRRQTDFPKLPG